MSFLDEISKLITSEKKKREEDEQKELAQNEEKRKKAMLVHKEESDEKVFNTFRTKYKYGTTSRENKDFQDVGTVSFKQCLEKAYCQNISPEDKICANDEKFYPYMAWKKLETQNLKGYCLLGKENNDTHTFNYEGDDAIPVYVTPLKTKGDITQNLDVRADLAKNEIINRLHNDLETTNRNLLYEKNRLEQKRENELKENSSSLNKLDKNILTTTKKIRENYNRFLMNDNLSNILLVSMIAIIIVLVFVVSYYKIREN